MNKAIVLLAVLLFSASNFHAQDLAKRAIENPLDCAFYLQIKDPSKIDGGMQAQAFVDLSRYDDAIGAISLDESSDDRFAESFYLATKLIRQGKPSVADRFVNQALLALAKQHWWSRKLLEFLSTLVRSDHQAEVAEILSHRSEWETTEQANVLIAVANAYAELGQSREAMKLVNEALELRDAFYDTSQLERICPIYVTLGDRERALSLLAEIRTQIATDPNDWDRDQTLLALIPQYFKLGRDDQARELWHQVSDPNDPDSLLSFARSLIASGKPDEARAILRQAEADSEFVGGWGGSELIEEYLKLNDVESAARVIEIKSAEEDSRPLQQAFMLLADRYIADGNSAAALKVTDLAWRKASVLRVENDPLVAEFDSPSDQQIAALKEIIDRYVKLKRTDRALAAIRTVTGQDNRAIWFRSRNYLNLAELEGLSQTHRQILDLLDQTERELGSDDDKSPDPMQIEVAAVYAKIGRRDTAIELLITVLKYNDPDDPYYRGMVLQMAAPVVDKYKLAADPRIRAVLKQIVMEADSEN